MQLFGGIALMLAGASVAGIMAVASIEERHRLAAYHGAESDGLQRATGAVPSLVPSGSQTPSGFLPQPVASASSTPLKPARWTGLATQYRASERAYAAARRSAYSGWTAVVTDNTTSSTTLKSSKAGDAQTRASLARDLQAGLKKAGCYGGEINGAWTQSTQRAMAAFMDRVNAALPIAEPDFILLTLVESHKGATCSDTCPNGQDMAKTGRCVPRALLAAKPKPAPRLAQRPPPPTVPKVETAQLPKAGRTVALAKSGVTRPPVHPSSGNTAETRVLATAEPEVLPWLVNDAAGRTDRRAGPAPSGRQLAGRMSVGGPIETRILPPPSTVTTGALALETAAPAPPRTAKAHRAKSRGKTARNKKLEQKRYYADRSYTGKGRRGQPRPGTMHHNLLLSMGGIY